MKIENLRKIVELSGFNLAEDDGIFYIADYSVYQTENPVLVCGLTERPHPTNKTWMVQGTSYDAGDRDTPPSSDVYDIQEFDSLEESIKFILIQLKKEEISNMFQSFAESEWEEEQRMFEQSDEYFA